MIRTKQLRSLMEARVNEAESAGLSVAAGRARFVQEVRASLGLMEEHRDSAGNVTGYTEVRDEFGRRGFTFDAPDGYQWMLIGATDAPQTSSR